MYYPDKTDSILQSVIQVQEEKDRTDVLFQTQKQKPEVLTGEFIHRVIQTQNSRTKPGLKHQ